MRSAATSWLLDGVVRTLWSERIRNEKATHDYNSTNAVRVTISKDGREMVTVWAGLLDSVRPIEYIGKSLPSFNLSPGRIN